MRKQDRTGFTAPRSASGQVLDRITNSLGAVKHRVVSTKHKANRRFGALERLVVVTRMANSRGAGCLNGETMIEINFNRPLPVVPFHDLSAQTIYPGRYRYNTHSVILFTHNPSEVDSMRLVMAICRDFNWAIADFSDRQAMQKLVSQAHHDQMAADVARSRADSTD